LLVVATAFGKQYLALVVLHTIAEAAAQLRMDNRRRSTRLSGAPDQELVSLESERKLFKASSKSNVKQQDGQQQPPPAAPTPARTNSTSSTDGGAGRSARGKQQPEQPLETFISIIETYFGPQSDAELVAAAEGVAEIWHLHDSSVRAALSDVLGPLLVKEEQLAQRAAAIKALRQERRDNFAQHGPRVRAVLGAAVHSCSMHACRTVLQEWFGSSNSLC
jgi:hypothetical protein